MVLKVSFSSKSLIMKGHSKYSSKVQYVILPMCKFLEIAKYAKMNKKCLLPTKSLHFQQDSNINLQITIKIRGWEYCKGCEGGRSKGLRLFKRDLHHIQLGGSRQAGKRLLECFRYLMLIGTVFKCMLYATCFHLYIPTRWCYLQFINGKTENQRCDLSKFTLLLLMVDFDPKSDSRSLCRETIRNKTSLGRCG